MQYGRRVYRIAPGTVLDRPSNGPALKHGRLDDRALAEDWYHYLAGYKYSRRT